MRIIYKDMKKIDQGKLSTFIVRLTLLLSEQHELHL